MIRENGCLSGNHMKTIGNIIETVFLLLYSLYHHLYHRSAQDGHLESFYTGVQST